LEKISTENKEAAKTFLHPLRIFILFIDFSVSYLYLAIVVTMTTGFNQITQSCKLFR